MLNHASRLLGNPASNEIDFRRAVSASYYSVFHLISAAVAYQVSPPNPAGLRGRCQRILEHRPMKNAMTVFLSSESLKKFCTDTGIYCAFDSDIAQIAKAFGELQDARHLADYDVVDVEGKVGLSWASECVDKAKRVFEAWDRAKSTDLAKLFLASIVFGGRWTK